jgi:hypothetical protein
MKIYEFLYCSSVFESAYASISLHKTKRGAWKAMNKWLNERYWREWDIRMKIGKEKPYFYKDEQGKQKYLLGVWRCGVHEAWTIGEQDLCE